MDCGLFVGIFRDMKKITNSEEWQKKVRVLHSAALLSPPSGITTQMAWEQDAARELDIDWQVKMYCPKNCQAKAYVLHHDAKIDAAKIKNPIKKAFAWFALRRNYHRWLIEQQNHVDVFLLRYYVHDPFQLFFVKRCKKPVFFIHHTLEVPELALPGGISGWVRSFLEKNIGPLAIGYAAGVIGVTQEIVDYELKRANKEIDFSFVYPNGIVFKQTELLDRRSDGLPELLFVANFAPWHGLDLLLKEVTKSSQEFVLHLVGKIPESLLPLASDRRIKVHGSLSHDEIAILSQQCWIGLASFALSRKKMKQACPLKTREYLMLGLPVYGDYQDIFPYDSSFFKIGSERIEEILEFSRLTRCLEKKEVANISKKWIDKIDLLGCLYKQF